MKLPLKFVQIKGGVTVSGFGAIAMGSDEKPIAWLDTESRTVLFVNRDNDEIPVEAVAKMRRATPPAPAKK